MSVKISGIGPVLACGEGVEALKTALYRGQSSTDNKTMIKGLEEFISPRSSRRMDDFTRMAVLSVCLALKDSGIKFDSISDSRTGIVFGTGLGPQGSTFSFLDGMIDDGDHCVSAFSFTNSVHSTPAAQVALSLGIQGPMRTITAFGHTAGAALETATSWLRNGKVKRVILILGDESSEVMNYSTKKMRSSSRIKPFSEECSYSPVAGFLTFILEDNTDLYCRITFLDMSLSIEEAAERSASCDMLFCALAGKADEFKLYKHICSKAPFFGTYSSLYGSFFTGAGAELAIAALSLREQVVFPIPGIDASDKGGIVPVEKKDKILKKAAVAVVNSQETVTYIELER